MKKINYFFVSLLILFFLNTNIKLKAEEYQGSDMDTVYNKVLIVLAKIKKQLEVVSFGVHNETKVQDQKNTDYIPLNNFNQFKYKNKTMEDFYNTKSFKQFDFSNTDPRINLLISGAHLNEQTNEQNEQVDNNRPQNVNILNFKPKPLSDTLEKNKNDDFYICESKKIIAIGFRGLRSVTKGENPSDGVDKAVDSVGGKSYEHNQVPEAFNYIKNVVSKNNNVSFVILGHSAGANSAISLVKLLKETKINITGLVVADPSKRYASSMIDMNIYSIALVSSSPYYQGVRLNHGETKNLGGSHFTIDDQIINNLPCKKQKNI